MKRPKIISIANQKGGVGKTTTAVNLSFGLAKLNKKVLLIDLDPQANASSYLGFKNNEKSKYIHELIDYSINDISINYEDFIITNNQNVDYIPSHLKLSSAEIVLINVMNREKVVEQILSDKYINKYDYVIIDCLPSLGILMINALSCSDEVIIPVQSQYFSLDGLDDFLNTVSKIKKKLNPKLEIRGILRTMTNNTIMSKEVKNNLINTFENKVFNIEIPMLVEAQNSTYTHESLINNEKSKIGQNYLLLAKNIIEN